MSLPTLMQKGVKYMYVGNETLSESISFIITFCEFFEEPTNDGKSVFLSGDRDSANVL